MLQWEGPLAVSPWVRGKQSPQSLCDQLQGASQLQLDNTAIRFRGPADNICQCLEPWACALGKSLLMNE